jgi:hypothetical protein
MPTVFKTQDIQTLADRLYGRGVSVLSADSPSLAADLRTASHILRLLLNKIDAVAAKANETAALLANLQLAVED